MKSLEVHFDPDADIVEEIRTQLQTFNYNAIGYFPKDVFSVTSKDVDGILIGGGVGVVTLGWLFVDLLWVHPEHRGRGLGKSIMHRMEGIALDRGATGVWLTTADFQSPDFYLSQGFEIFAELPVHSPEHERPFREFFLRKNL